MTRKNTSAADLFGQTELWPVDRIKPSERNARKHPKKQIDQLRAVFREFGQVWPVLVREDGTIIAGHGRFEAAKLEEFAQIRVLVARGWPEKKCRAFAILDNKIPLNATWDSKLLGLELAELGGLGVEAGLLGFDPSEAAALMPAVVSGGSTDPNAAPAPEVRPVSAPGDVWVLGDHRLGCGDATNQSFVLRVLAGEKPPLMVTDPPYGVDYDPAWRTRAGLSESVAAGKVRNDDQADWRHAFEQFSGAVAYVWHGALHGAEVERSLQACGFQVRAQIVWVKPRFALSRGHYHWQHEPAFYAVKDGAPDEWRFIPEHEIASYAVLKGESAEWTGGRRQSTVWHIEHVKNETGHGTQKPIECMRRPIENNSKPGDAVYEPFSGSGTTIVAAEMTGRRCRAVEIDPLYVDVAIRRWQDFTGKKAVLDGDGRSFEEVAAARLAKAA